MYFAFQETFKLNFTLQAVPCEFYNIFKPLETKQWFFMLNISATILTINMVNIMKSLINGYIVILSSTADNQVNKYFIGDTKAASDKLSVFILLAREKCFSCPRVKSKHLLLQKLINIELKNLLPYMFHLRCCTLLKTLLLKCNLLLTEEMVKHICVFVFRFMDVERQDGKVLFWTCGIKSATLSLTYHIH